MQSCPGCEYRVDGIFIWNDASWDVQAIYPESTTGEGSYKCAHFILCFYALIFITGICSHMLADHLSDPLLHKVLEAHALCHDP